MARRKSKKKKLRTIACKHLVQLNEISNSGNPLCYCEKRDFNLSPFNFVCQVCELYSENKQDITHDQMYQAEGAEVEINWDDIVVEDEDEEEEEEEIDEDLFADADEFDDDLLIDKQKFQEEEEFEEEEDEEDEEEEEIIDDDADGLIIGHEEEEEEEDLLDYEDEREEALGKKGTILGIEDEEDLESELEDLEEELGYEEELDEDEEEGEEEGKIPTPKKSSTKKSKPSSKSSAKGLDFEKDVLSKVTTVEKKGEERQVCPYCGKDYKAVLRHVYRCKRAPEGIEEAYEEYKKTH